ncbi:MAG: hypothetical protein JNG89_04310 [Planctomycetaceae bacterium]|nr:hypothetical protein [Planctomycetaceae bacterium]
MSPYIYGLCALTAILCAWLLLRTYLQNRVPLLFWSGLCFVFLSANNLLVVLDRVVFPTQIDLGFWRMVLALLAPVVLLFGLIWEHE